MKQVNLRIYQTILTLLVGLFLSAGAYAQQISVRGIVKDQMGRSEEHTSELQSRE